MFHSLKKEEKVQDLHLSYLFIQNNFVSVLTSCVGNVDTKLEMNSDGLIDGSVT